jgi:hypothetical protein
MIKYKLEQVILNAGKKNQEYSEQEWKDTIDELLNKLKFFLKQDFQLATDFIDLIVDSRNPYFSRWIWSEQKELPFFSATWSGLIYGELKFNEKGEEIFNIGISMFLFDSISGEPLCLKTGESVILFSFQIQANGEGLWVNLGWVHDETKNQV